MLYVTLTGNALAGENATNATTTPIDAASAFETEFNMNVPFPWDVTAPAVGPDSALPDIGRSRKILTLNEKLKPTDWVVWKRRSDNSGYWSWSYLRCFLGDRRRVTYGPEGHGVVTL